VLEDTTSRGLTFLLTIVLLGLLRWLVPSRNRAAEHKYDAKQTPKPLRAGVAKGVMVGIGIALALTFFLLRWTNQLWAAWEGSAELTQYPTPWIWGFFPGFAALSVPWPLLVWWLRRRGRWEEANAIEDCSDSKSGANSYVILKWMALGLAIPVGLFTLLAIPIHLSISGLEVRVGHYASLRTERFDLREARRATLVYGYRLRDGSLKLARDLVIDFADGRRLKGNQVGDGDTSIREDVLQLLLKKIGLEPGYAETGEEIPPLDTGR
jgi:hypothetical protein